MYKNIMVVGLDRLNLSSGKTFVISSIFLPCLLLVELSTRESCSYSLAQIVVVFTVVFLLHDDVEFKKAKIEEVTWGSTRARDNNPRATAATVANAHGNSRRQETHSMTRSIVKQRDPVQ